MSTEELIQALKQKPTWRWATITSGCFLAGFMAAPFGMLVSVFAAPLAAMLLLPEHQGSKIGKVALQSSCAILAFYVAAFTSTFGMLSNPLWWHLSERNKRTLAKSVSGNSRRNQQPAAGAAPLLLPEAQQ